MSNAPGKAVSFPGQRSDTFLTDHVFTVLSNRIGDVALLRVISWISNFGSMSFNYYLEFLSGFVEMKLNTFLVCCCGCYN